MEETESRAGLNTAVISKCLNPNCGWETKTGEEVVSDDLGNIFCPMCGRQMQGEIN